MRSFKDHLRENIPPEVVGAAVAAPALAHGAKHAVKGAYKVAKAIYKGKKATTMNTLMLADRYIKTIP